MRITMGEDAMVISRREFVGGVGSAIVMSRLSWAEERVPGMLDHILLGCSDLDAGIEFVEKQTGVRAAIGGVHPGAGTRNALLSLGVRRYLEIIAPDPAQKEVRQGAAERVNRLKQLEEPRLIEWAAHVDNMEALAKKLRNAGVAFEGPAAGSRKRPDGRVLQWKSLGLADSRNGLLPFFIEWGATSVHPSVDAPAGCSLESFVVGDKDPEKLATLFRRLEVEVPVSRADRPQITARIATQNGVMELMS